MTDEETYNEMISEDVPNMPQRLIKQSFEALEHNYDTTQRAKMEAMHNAIVEDIRGHHARPEHILLVLEVLRSEIVSSCAGMFFAPPPSPPPRPAVKTEENANDDVEEDSLE
jgi:hypothetical protein